MFLFFKKTITHLYRNRNTINVLTPYIRAIRCYRSVQHVYMTVESFHCELNSVVVFRQHCITVVNRQKVP
jgi:hypothetical protein